MVHTVAAHVFMYVWQQLNHLERFPMHLTKRAVDKPVILSLGCFSTWAPDRGPHPHSAQSLRPQGEQRSPSRGSIKCTCQMKGKKRPTSKSMKTSSSRLEHPSLATSAKTASMHAWLLVILSPISGVKYFFFKLMIDSL